MPVYWTGMFQPAKPISRAPAARDPEEIRQVHYSRVDELCNEIKLTVFDGLRFASEYVSSGGDPDDLHGLRAYFETQKNREDPC